jgi:benzoyl-CoA reductase/2-hydroxyglutaryl-CoA dehydratase subunit BcrC/BadD/HgdB
VPLALLGGPLTVSDLDLFDLVERHGGCVVLDGAEDGERGLPARFDRRKLADEPLNELADAYFGSIPDVFQRPNSRLYTWIAREVAAREVRGLLLVRHVWCDLWHAEVERLREWLEIPLLDLDLGEAAPIAIKAGRIQAFLETLT